jgi:hypothetical protein
VYSLVSSKLFQLFACRLVRLEPVFELCSPLQLSFALFPDAKVITFVASTASAAFTGTIKSNGEFIQNDAARRGGRSRGFICLPCFGLWKCCTFNVKCCGNQIARCQPWYECLSLNALPFCEQFKIN